MKIRNAARLILIDEQNRVLLFKIKDPYNPELEEFWVTQLAIYLRPLLQGNLPTEPQMID